MTVFQQHIFYGTAIIVFFIVFRWYYPIAKEFIIKIIQRINKKK